MNNKPMKSDDPVRLIIVTSSNLIYGIMTRKDASDCMKRWRKWRHDFNTCSPTSASLRLQDVWEMGSVVEDSEELFASTCVMTSHIIGMYVTDMPDTSHQEKMNELQLEAMKKHVRDMKKDDFSSDDEEELY